MYPFSEGMESTEIETAHHHHEDDQMRALYEASYKGCVSTLNSLIKQDPLILHKISSQTVFTENPMHISTLLGHFEFTKALLSHKPNLAHELNSFRSTALHIASAEGHVDIVKELLLAYVEACMARDREGRIPLHYGIIRGRLEVVRELVRAKPESLRKRHKGKTVFHLCVEYDHLEILKALVELDITDTGELLNFKDLDGGNTILHLAVTFKQVEIVRYLLSISKIREASKMRNKMGFTASDIVVRIPKDLKSLEIQVVFMNRGIKFERREESTEEDAEANKEKWWRKFLKKTKEWLEYKGDYLEDMRGNLSLVSTVIATMTFQAALNPPGSYVQQGISDTNNNTTAPQYNTTDFFDFPYDIYFRSRSMYNYTNRIDDDGRPLSCFLFLDDGNNVQGACPGEALLASVYPGDFLKFVIFNTISFMSSLAATVLLVSGVPLKHTSVILMLSLGMCVALYSLAMAYFYSFSMMIPDNIKKESNHIFDYAYTSMLGLLGLAGIYIAVKFVVLAVTKCRNIIQYRIKSPCTRNRGLLSQCASFFGYK